MKPIIAITTGDINGIGYEIIFKSLSNPHILDICTPVIYGNVNTAKYHLQTLDDKIQKMPLHVIKNTSECKEKGIYLINVYSNNVMVTFGRSTADSDKAAYDSLQAACSDLKNNKVQALVTAPLCKSSLQGSNDSFTGHTEFMAHFFNTDKTLMMMVNDFVKLGLVTTHLPLSSVAASITADMIIEKVVILQKTLREYFVVPNPKIAVLGLNPHCGDNGLIGKEEEMVIIPAVKALNEQNILAFGPYSPDGFWGNGDFSHFDAILAMYHDQGLIPFKLLDNGGFNFTAGLPVVRTSPDHGVAFDIAGKNRASHQSFTNALYAAIDLLKTKTAYDANTANPLPNNNNQTLQNNDK